LPRKLAAGRGLVEAATLAKAYVTKAIEKGYAVGKGRVPLDHFYRLKIEPLDPPRHSRIANPRHASCRIGSLTGATLSRQKTTGDRKIFQRELSPSVRPGSCAHRTVSCAILLGDSFTLYVHLWLVEKNSKVRGLSRGELALHA